jgi:hypothetical protein
MGEVERVLIDRWRRKPAGGFKNLKRLDSLFERVGEVSTG